MYLPQHTPLLRFGGFGPVDVEAMLENAFARKIMQAATREGLRQVRCGGRSLRCQSQLVQRLGLLRVTVKSPTLLGLGGWGAGGRGRLCAPAARLNCRPSCWAPPRRGSGAPSVT